LIIPLEADKIKVNTSVQLEAESALLKKNIDKVTYRLPRA